MGRDRQSFPASSCSPSSAAAGRTRAPPSPRSARRSPASAIPASAWCATSSPCWCKCAPAAPRRLTYTPTLPPRRAVDQVPAFRDPRDAATFDAVKEAVTALPLAEARGGWRRARCATPAPGRRSAGIRCRWCRCSANGWAAGSRRALRRAAGRGPERDGLHPRRARTAYALSGGAAATDPAVRPPPAAPPAALDAAKKSR